MHPFIPLLFVVALLTAGCGQKGDLYLPDQPQAQDSGEQDGQADK